MRTPVIWRIQEPHAKVEAERDYASLVGYGEIKTILGPKDNPCIDFESASIKVIEAIQDIQDGDYILWAGGDPMSAFLMGMLLGMQEYPKRLKWLRWDKRTDASGNRTKFGYYTPVEFSS